MHCFLVLLPSFSLAAALVDAHLPNESCYGGAALNVPVYLHPTYPSLGDVLGIANGLYVLSHERTGFGFLGLNLCGIFKRPLGLQNVLGHVSELVPYYIWRSDLYLSRRRKRTLSQVYAENVYVTTSDIFTLDPAATLVRNTARKRILYGVDWRLAANEDGAALMASLQNSASVTSREFSQIAYQNAAHLLNIT